VGNPHLAFSAWGDLTYIWWTGSDWSSEVITSSVSVPALALDSSDQPHIGFELDGRLYYAYKDGAWAIEPVDTQVGQVGQSSMGLALDGGNRPRIAYHDQTCSDLKFAWRDQAGTVPSSGGSLGVFGLASFEFPPGAVTSSVDVAYTPLEPFGPRAHAGLFYDVAMTRVSDGQPAQIAPGQTYSVTLWYDQADVPRDYPEGDLALHYWDEASQRWVREPTSTIDTETNIIQARPGHASVWAVLVSWRDVYLPLVMRSTDT
jgi:hypothetical protein